MGAHNELGRQGEEAAAFFLEDQGYAIRHRNWFNKHKELDLVAEKAGELIIAEVKTRTATGFNKPEDTLSPVKIRRLVQAADVYVKCYELDMPLRYDLIYVVSEEGRFQIEHYPGAFHAPIW